jgi:hypothetical protein
MARFPPPSVLAGCAELPINGLTQQECRKSAAGERHEPAMVRDRTVEQRAHARWERPRTHSLLPLLAMSFIAVTRVAFGLPCVCRPAWRREDDVRPALPRDCRCVGCEFFLSSSRDRNSAISNTDHLTQRPCFLPRARSKRKSGDTTIHLRRVPLSTPNRCATCLTDMSSPYRRPSRSAICSAVAICLSGTVATKKDCQTSN